MNINNEVTIRKIESTDIEKLITFFIKAYGNNTIFQDENFLLYYFNAHNEILKPLSYSLIGVSKDGEIVSHYGGIHYKLKLNQKIISIIWGVNAYTLPDWRGKGINSNIVRYIHENNEVNAVIGMPFDAPLFYEKYGYNIFNKDTLNRFIFVLDSKVYGIVDELGYSSEKAKKLLKFKETENFLTDSKRIVELTEENFDMYEFSLNIEDVTSTYRDDNFLRWRVFKNPYINYKVFGYLKNNKIITYVAIREEVLKPSNLKVNRIIDIFGDEEGISDLLNTTINHSVSNGSIYIDFSMYGKLYENNLLRAGFTKLMNDEVCILPMVTAPIENRPNHEFIVMQSKMYDDEIQSLSSENVYFTRIDGDRDRIARITQLNKTV